MSNFFAALDDSGDEGVGQQQKPAKKAPPKKKPEIVEPSKVPSRQRPGDDRNHRGGRGDRHPPREGKRAYDRRSGTGRGKEIKKGGGGAHNWGSDKNDARAAEGEVTEAGIDAAVEGIVEEVEGPKEGGEEGDEEVADDAQKEDRPNKQKEEEEEEEEEEVTISYDEYMQMKESERPDSEAFRQLSVKELDAEDAFKGVAAAKKKEEEAFLVMGGGKQPRKKGKGKQEKKAITPSFRVGEQVGRGGRGGSRDGGGRGGGRYGERREGGRGGSGYGERREGGRGGGGGRGERGGRGRGDRGRGRGRDRGSYQGSYQKKSTQLDVEDAEAFPSL